jgi:pilus assembly protein CpaB
MRMKSLILIFIALGCGLVASIGISQVMERGGNSGSGVEMEQILVALTDIDAGAKLDAKNVKLEDWPKNKVPEAAIRRVEDANGKYAVPRFFKGEPIVATRISESANGVSHQIPDGFRAEPVKVEEDTVMKAISPGDRVDVSVFLKRDGNEIHKTGIFPILRNVQIFAVNSNTERTSDSKGEGAFRTVSLLVKEKQVGELQLAKRMGSIQLSLRRPNESDEGKEDVSSMADLLAGKGEQGGTVQEAPPANNGLSNLLSSGSPAGGVPMAGVWQLQIQGPNGVELWDWQSRNGLPTKLSALSVDGGSGGTTTTGAGSYGGSSSSSSSDESSQSETTETVTEETTSGLESPAE